MSAPDVLTQAISDAYDETPYISLPFCYTSPGNLRAVASLYQLEAPALERARVLELGCAAGGNLLPFALAHPEARVVGIDLSPQQIEAGQRTAEALGVRNLDLRAMSLTEITADFGTFDYIICHGVFSWVPPEVRDAILRICRENLAPQGIAYVSYNTYPGWKASDVIRDAMILNSFGAETPQDKLVRAKAMLELIEAGLWQNNPLRSALQEAARKLRGQTDHYLLHEYLEAINTPCYFLEFAAAAQQAGLAYVTDAEPQLTFPSTFGSMVALGLNGLSVNAGREMREQYLDFAVGRSFRKSLLVHAERAGEILDQPEGGAFTAMHFAADLTPLTGAPAGQRQYRTAAGTAITTQDPAMIALMEALAQAWPQSLPFAALLETQRGHAADASADALSNAMIGHLVTLVQAGALHYRLEPAPYQPTQARPRLIPGALQLLQEVTRPGCQVGMHNLWHHPVNAPTDALYLYLTRHIDGDHSAAELRTLARDALTAGRHPHPDGKSYKGARNLDPVAQEIVNSLLTALRRVGLLLH
ncbi:class I SAM-dependent methyltransferase [Achromobacter sp. SIMBA_011]|uniref:methyltransferase regulatory domain-containing protein n=1 Tax=Achromobacter TaxID=222 RepID=UPI0007E26116|nr:class I SAM-dependent methyltransferase [Achromobacter dolens]OAS93257.1 methyltransferase [Achromobacter xylosoxidans]